jgi:hypothetical protein
MRVTCSSEQLVRTRRHNLCAFYLCLPILYLLALTSPTGGGRSVGMVRSRTKATEFSFYTVPSLYYILGPQYYKHPNILTGRIEIFDGCKLLTRKIRAGQEKLSLRLVG